MQKGILCGRHFNASPAKFSTKTFNGSDPSAIIGPGPDVDKTHKSKSVTQIFTEAIQTATSRVQFAEQRTVNLQIDGKRVRLIKPTSGYSPRFSYNGHLKNCTWISYDDQPKQPATAAYMEQQRNYAKRKKSKYCLLLAFAGDNYYGMQYNESLHTIEKQLFAAMIKNDWMLPEHLDHLTRIQFIHGSRTDRGVSALRMNCSIILRKFEPYLKVALF